MGKSPRQGLVSRRQLLGVAGTAAVTAALAGCSVVTSAPKSSSTSTKSGKIPEIVFPRSNVNLPKNPTTFSWMDSGGLKTLFEQPMFSAYEKVYPTVKISYDDTSWTVIDETVPVGVRNGSAPDVFQMPDDVPPQIAVNEGWVAPLDDVIPNFQQWKSRYPATAFIPGVHVFNGKTYGWTFTSSRSQYGELLVYDVEYLKRAGYDPSQARMTWNDFRQACKKVTKQGSGSYYGLMTAGPDLGGLVLTLAELAGAIGGEMNWKTGLYNYTAPEMQAAVEMLLAVKSDGSIFPGFMSLNDQTSRARMPNRVAGMIFDGPWDIPAWQQSYPQYNFGIAETPTPHGKWAPYSYQEGTAAPLWVFSGSKNKEIAGQLFSYMGGLTGQRDLVAYTEGIFLSEIASVNAAVKRDGLLKGRAKRAVEIMQGMMRMEPIVETRNPATAEVILEQKPVVPSMSDVVEGIFSGQITNIRSAFQSLQDRSEASLDAAIKVAKTKGAKVSRDDWKFSNWNPNVDYTEKYYKHLNA